MKVGFFNYYPSCNDNNMFKNPSVFPMGDDLTYPFVHLFERAKSEGIEISTIDTQPLESYDIIFFFDFPTFSNPYFKNLIKSEFKNLILFLYENETIMRDNWNWDNYHYFKKVYTYNDGLVDNKKFFKYYFPIKVPKNIDFNFDRKKKLCTMIAWNKFNEHPLELYSARVEAIRWFEENHPENFDLYGVDWDTKAFETDANIWWKKEWEIRREARPEEMPFTSYKGPVESKNETLKKYKFSICYENAQSIPGYISEKIFDCFFAGCVPIYWGAPNVTEYIPPETFIDKRKFDSYSDLYDYIKNMSEETYQGYLEAIEAFVTGNKIYPFSAENFADTILNEIHTTIGKK